jgi:hypothetical protein
MSGRDDGQGDEGGTAKTVLQAQMGVPGRQIVSLVIELYDLTTDRMQIVEERGRRLEPRKVSPELSLCRTRSLKGYAPGFTGTF